jgi:hypothetical protein
MNALGDYHHRVGASVAGLRGGGRQTSLSRDVLLSRDTCGARSGDKLVRHEAHEEAGCHRAGGGEPSSVPRR